MGEVHSGFDGGVAFTVVLTACLTMAVSCLKGLGLLQRVRLSVIDSLPTGLLRPEDRCLKPSRFPPGYPSLRRWRVRRWCFYAAGPVEYRASCLVCSAGPLHRRTSSLHRSFPDPDTNPETLIPWTPTQPQVASHRRVPARVGRLARGRRRLPPAVRSSERGGSYGRYGRSAALWGWGRGGGDR